jgi:hypothetical protein
MTEFVLFLFKNELFIQKNEERCQNELI